MRTEKVSVSIPADVLAETRQRTRGRSLSAYVTEGLRRQILAERQAELMEDWEAEFGPITEAELEQARRWLAD